jgi:hypothetical protein
MAKADTLLILPILYAPTLVNPTLLISPPWFLSYDRSHVRQACPLYLTQEKPREYVSRQPFPYDDLNIDRATGALYLATALSAFPRFSGTKILS